MSGYRMGRVVVMLGTLVAAGGMAQAQTPSEPSCTLEKQVYKCDWQAFVQRLDKSHTVAVETQSSVDRFTAKQLRELAGELGKTVAPEDQLGDLTFLLIPLQSTGVHYGPAGEAIATLRPWGVDVASGVEASPGKKDPAKVRAFVENARVAAHPLDLAARVVV